MNVNQSEYCGKSMIADRGAGYYAVLTETDVIPATSMEHPLFLSPGYTNQVILKSTEHRRYTENLGLCSSYVDLYLYPLSDKYIQPLCFDECIVREILQHCSCYPPQLASQHDLFLANANNLGIRNTTRSIRMCRESELICPVSFWFDVFLNQGQNTLCPHCKTPCFENKYRFHVTRSLISISLLKRDIGNASTISDEELRKNYLYVNVGFENKEVTIIEERQAITLIDLFIYLGNNIGLFLGMSFMSNFEILINLIFRSIFAKSEQGTKFRNFLKKIFFRKTIKNTNFTESRIYNSKLQTKRRRKRRIVL